MFGLEVHYAIVSARPGIEKYLWETSPKAQACIFVLKTFPHKLNHTYGLSTWGNVIHYMTMLWLLVPLFVKGPLKAIYVTYIFLILFYFGDSPDQKLGSFCFIYWHFL